MYNVYTAKKGVNNKPSLTLKEFSDEKGVSCMRMTRFIANDKTISAAFNRRRANFYHVEDLNNWWRINSAKF